MKMSGRLAGLLFRRNPFLSVVAIAALSLISWMTILLGSVQKEVSATQAYAKESQWLLLSFSAESDATKAMQEIKTAPGTEASMLNPTQVIEQLTQLDSSLGQLLSGLGTEASSVVPSLISINGIMSSEQIETWKRLPGVIRSEIKPTSHSRLQDFYATLGREIDLAWWGLLIVSLTILSLLAQVYRGHYHGIAESLESWGVPALRIRFPLWMALVSALSVSWLGTASIWFAFRNSGVAQGGFLGALTVQPGLQFTLGTFFILIIAQIFGITLFALAGRQDSRR